MKKTTFNLTITHYFLAFIALLFTTIGCRKTITAEQEATATRAIKVPVSEEPNNMRPKWLDVAIADVKGAIAGGGVGGTIGGPVGAGVGAVIGGAAYSVEKATEKVAASPSGAPVAYGGESLNPDNPFDYIGQRHYELTNSILNNPLPVINETQNGINDEAYYGYASNYAAEAGWATPDQVNSFFPFGSFTTLMEDLRRTPNEGLSEYVARSYAAGNISDNVYKHLYPYSQTFDQATNVQVFQAYSRQQEKKAMSDPSLRQSEKQLILGTMSTARIGIAYYYRPPFL